MNQPTEQELKPVKARETWTVHSKFLQLILRESKDHNYRSRSPFVSQSHREIRHYQETRQFILAFLVY